MDQEDLEELNEIRRKEFMEQLIAFKQDDTKQSLNFPETLNAFERALIHEIAESIGGLKHESEGIGKQRHIVVSKNLQMLKRTLEEEESEKALPRAGKNGARKEKKQACPE